jgi:hypothetical protein
VGVAKPSKTDAPVAAFLADLDDPAKQQKWLNKADRDAMIDADPNLSQNDKAHLKSGNFNQVQNTVKQEATAAGQPAKSWLVVWLIADL